MSSCYVVGSPDAGCTIPTWATPDLITCAFTDSLFGQRVLRRIMIGEGDDEEVKALTVCEIRGDSFAVWIHPDGNIEPVSGDCRCGNPVPRIRDTDDLP